MSYRSRNRAIDEAAREWHGGYRPYDLVKEATIAVAAITLLTVVLAIVFSSPDEKPVTIQGWSRAAPLDFVTTAVSELDGTSGTATYGPPYNHASSGQHIAFIRLQKWLGVAHPINAANDYVVAPLRSINGNPTLQAAVTRYQQAPPSARAAWTTAYGNALAKSGDSTAAINSLVDARYGPVPTMMDSLLTLAQSGGLDGALLTSRQFYSTDYTKILMLVADGGYLGSKAQADHLLGEQWGMMNETGSFPGQSWLWLYTLWYQIKPFSTSDNADVLVMAMMGVLSLALLIVPFTPGIRDIPLKIPVYRLVWREHYRSQQSGSGTTGQ